MYLNVRITAVEDGRFSMAVEELPELAVETRNYEEIPDAVSAAAAEMLGRNPGEFTVGVRF